MKDQTLNDHNKKQRRDFECETHNFIRPATNGNLAYLNFECLWKHIETQNKALLKKERERVGGVIDGEIIYGILARLKAKGTDSIGKECRITINSNWLIEAQKQIKQTLCQK